MLILKSFKRRKNTSVLKTILINLSCTLGLVCYLNIGTLMQTGCLMAKYKLVFLGL